MPSRSPKKKPFLSLRQATFRLGDRLVFENTNWNLNRDEQWAIIGTNGSGKSVLADALRGRLPLVQGELSYHFRPPPHLSPEETIGHVAFEDRKSEIHGEVVQSRWMSFEQEAAMSVADFLSYERVMEVNPFEVDPRHTVARAQFERRLRRATRLFQVGGFLPRRLLSLSNGERQRVQLTRALAQPLRLLILDEPYVGLDRAAREHFHRVLERLLATSLRVLLVTTRAEELPRHISHLLWVDECRVVEAGRRAEVQKRRGSSAGASGGRRAEPGPKKIVSRRKTSRLIDFGSGRDGGGQCNLVELRNVTVRYGDKVVLNRINWTVREGESWAVLGPNGSGKTTLLSLIQGDHPQAYVNDVIVFGRRRGTGESVWELKKPIGWVSPELQLHFDDSVSVFDAVVSGFQDTIGVFAAPARGQWAAARAWLRHFELMPWADHPLFSLSAGLQRMALLARALVKQPRLLILDEPCQGLDRAHRELIIKQVDALLRAGRVTAIFVTHRTEEIPKSVKKVLRL